MRSAPEHLEAVLATVQPLEPLEVGLLGSVGLVLAQDIVVEDDGHEYQLLGKGTEIAARHVALLAAAGLGRVLVHPMPRVVVLTVGEDLTDPGTDNELIPDVNGVALTSAATAAGAMTFRVGPLHGDETSLRSALEDQLVRSDVILTACGMSADDYELLATVLRSMGHMDFVRVSMQPGGTQGFGTIGPDDTPVAMGTLLRVAMNSDSSGILEGLRAENFIRPGIHIDPDALRDYLAPFTEPAQTPTFKHSREWLREQFARTSDPRNPDWAIGLKINLPPNYLLIHRVWLGSIGVLCQLGAEFSVVDEFNEWIPGFANPDPSQA